MNISGYRRNGQVIIICAVLWIKYDSLAELTETGNRKREPDSKRNYNYTEDPGQFGNLEIWKFQLGICKTNQFEVPRPKKTIH